LGANENRLQILVETEKSFAKSAEAKGIFLLIFSNSLFNKIAKFPHLNRNSVQIK